jgi:hypothetical protein
VISDLRSTLDDNTIDASLNLKEPRLVVAIAVCPYAELVAVLHSLHRLPAKSQVIGVQVQTHEWIGSVDAMGIRTHVWANVFHDGEGLRFGNEVLELVAAP